MITLLCFTCILQIAQYFVPLIISILALDRLKKLIKSAEAALKEQGVKQEQINDQPLGEFFVKLQKYGAYLEYQKNTGKNN